MAVYYDVLLVISVVLFIISMFLRNRHYDIHLTLIFTIIPIVNLSHAMVAHAETLDEALAAQKFTYIGGCYLMLFLLFSVCSLCGISLNRWIRAGMLTVSTVVFAFALTIGSGEYFYKHVEFANLNGLGEFVKEYGPLHTVFLLLVSSYLLMSIAVIVYAYFRKNQISRKILALLFIPMVAAFIGYFVGRGLHLKLELLPLVYTLAAADYLLIARQVHLHDVTTIAMDSLLQTGDAGLVAFDRRLRYLGSNETAKAVFPVLNTLTVDTSIGRSPEMQETALPWLLAFQSDESKNTVLYKKGEETYRVLVTYLFAGNRKNGYQFVITDDTKNQQYIKLLNSYNTQLEQEVAEKTRHVVEMHDRLIISMATMVESRDNSTGGHIRRTSEGVRLLVEEMRKNPANGLSDKFCADIVKAAPMHDLGKIAVDDAILRKPGRFTPEEFAIMKTHAAEGARIVHEILDGTDDLEFHLIAENVAHYHHERWDGSGYPEGLKGEAIPPEARIMAIADVYDALVSKRVYKDSMSLDAANAIIMDGMGKQFDPALEQYYILARPALEAYYRSL